MAQLGSAESPLRVAIIGSGPSGFYAADYLLKQDLSVEIDMFDRLPTPFGLVRGGVAPDHDKIKSVTKVYEKIAASPQFRFYGNVEFGKHLTHADLKAHYHAVIYAVGAQTDRRLGIAGEDLAGSHAATEFVGWYNAHPDFRDLQFDLSVERALVVGNGNVAMDVARILVSSHEELAKTDIADYALEALRHSKVKEVILLGRRGPAQAAFTNPELKEFGELAEAAVIISTDDATLDPLSQAEVAATKDPDTIKNIEMLARYAATPPADKPRRIVMRFLRSPVELIGTDKVEAVKIVTNELVAGADGSLKAKATDQTETLPVGLVFRSIGYMGVALPDVPFDAKAGVIPNKLGRVFDPATGQAIVGEYVVGWIKRGPSGIIGTNKPDSGETVQQLIADLDLLPAVTSSRQAVEALIAARQPQYFSLADWHMLDQIEQSRGAEQGRPRVKFSTIDAMVEAVKVTSTK